MLRAFHDTWLGDFARDNAWFFTLGLILHFVGLCALLGTMLVIDLRVLGVARRMPVAGALSLLPLALAGFALNLLTGVVFFCFDPFGYWQNPAFKLKLLLIVAAGLNALFFAAVARRTGVLGVGHEPAAMLKVSAALSLMLWFGTLLLGRLIVAFQGSSAF